MYHLLPEVAQEPEQRRLEVQAPAQGPILSQGWYPTPPCAWVLLITPTSPALLGVEQGAWHDIYLFMSLRGWSSHINMQKGGSQSLV